MDTKSHTKCALHNFITLHGGTCFHVHRGRSSLLLLFVVVFREPQYRNQCEITRSCPEASSRAPFVMVRTAFPRPDEHADVEAVRRTSGGDGRATASFLASHVPSVPAAHQPALSRLWASPPSTPMVLVPHSPPVRAVDHHHHRRRWW